MNCKSVKKTKQKVLDTVVKNILSDARIANMHFTSHVDVFVHCKSCYPHIRAMHEITAGLNLVEFSEIEL